MKQLLIVICSTILALLIWASVAGFQQQHIFDAALQLWPDLWFRATLIDLYCGLLLFYLWIAWRERTAAARVVWLILLITLGNMATAAYLLLQLHSWRPSDGIAELLARK